MKDDDHHDQDSGGLEANGACERVLGLIPMFVDSLADSSADSEASVSLVSAVRKHLVECADCRIVAQEEKSLRQWFEPIAGEAGRADIVVPEGFAARVTAMAFSRGAFSRGAESDLEFAAAGGATDHKSGLRSESQVRRGPRLLRSPHAVSATPGPAERDASPERSSLGFLVSLTAVAAALMVTLTLMLAQDKRLDVGDVSLSADAPLDETLRELEALNELEMQALESEAAGQEDPSQEGGDVTSLQGDER